MLTNDTSSNRIRQLLDHKRRRGSTTFSTKSPATPLPVPDSAAAFATGTLGLRPDPVQLDLLAANPHRLLLNCCRQWGKSTVTAAKAVHQAYVSPGSLILVVSPSGRQSSEFLRKASTYLTKLGIQPRGDGDNDISLLLPNASRIVGLPGKDDTIRGFSAVSLLLIDEASRVSNDLYLAVRPMLAASNGQLWIMSTPRGRRGFFYDVWASGESNWTRLAIPATECPRISPAFLEEERRAMPARIFEQEYLCQFHEPEDAVFAYPTLKAAFVPIRPLFRHSDIPPLATRESRFYIGVDLGQKHDYTAIAIIERAEIVTGPRDRVTYELPTQTIYAVRHLERLPLGTPYPEIVAHIRALSCHPELGPHREVIVDATGVGQPVVDLLRRASLECRLVPVTLTSGGKATRHRGEWRVPRHELLTTLELSLQQEHLKISSALPHADTLLAELQSLRRKVTDSGMDNIHPWRDSQHDDFVFATALANWRANRP